LIYGEGDDVMSASGSLDKLKVTVLAEDSVLYESPFWGQHGVSFFLEAYKDDVRRNVLVDVAQSPEALLHNMKLHILRH